MIDTLYSLSKSDPLLVAGFLVSLLVCAGGFLIRARMKVTHRIETAEREPEPLRRVVLDATARFPPRASDRRAS